MLLVHLIRCLVDLDTRTIFLIALDNLFAAHNSIRKIWLLLLVSEIREFTV